MSRNARLLLYALLVSAHIACAAQIVLVYPRSAKSEPYVYAENVDSTFVLGRVEPPGGELSVNGTRIEYDDRGAFLAWLPLRKTFGKQSWDIELRNGTQPSGSLSLPYTLASDTAKTIPAAGSTEIHFPRVVRVTASNAHARTAVDGTYHVFPDIGCKLLALGRENGLYQFQLSDGIHDYIEDSAVELEADTSLSDALLEHGACTKDATGSICSFAITRPVPWTAQLSSDARTLIIRLFGVRAGTNRIRFDVMDALIHDVVWNQGPDALELDVRCTQPISRGFEVSCADSLRIRVRAPYPNGKHSLRGKTIVLDPGHGGNSAGAVGPLGTKEKDVVLKWALMLGEQLRREGAIVKFTRTTDTDLALYDRADFAQRVSADFFLSLHCNALPDTENPLIRHGSGTYYYQSGSRNAAEIMHKRLLAATKLRDDGLYDANLAVIRPTDFPAVLIEAAYLIYPSEERLLQSDEFLRSLGRGVVRGLNDYFQRVP